MTNQPNNYFAGFRIPDEKERREEREKAQAEARAKLFAMLRKMRERAQEQK